MKPALHLQTEQFNLALILNKLDDFMNFMNYLIIKFDYSINLKILFNVIFL